MEKSEQLKEFQKIIKVLDHIGFSGEMRSYSGRGMYGEYCVGIVMSGSDFYSCCENLDDKGIGYSTDSMGMSNIIYFRSIEFETVEDLIPEYYREVEDED